MNVTLLLAVCRSGTSPDGPGPIRPDEPLQVIPASDPSFAKQADSSVLFAKILVPDSTLHVQWRPSRLLVESSRGFSDTVLMAPYACLLPVTVEGIAFPRSFLWRECDRIVLLTTVPLSDERLSQVAASVSGSVGDRQVFSRPQPPPFFEGVIAKYSLYVPPGRAATDEAMRRLNAYPETWGTDHGLADPWCALSDAIPPPPCPPWHLQARLRYSFAASPGLDSIPVEPGGWIRITYPGADGSMRSAMYTFPQ